MGLLRGIARTAVISGTATAVSNNVSRRQAQRWSNQSQEEAPVQQPVSQATTDPYEELTKLSQLKDQGIITQEEFDAKKQQLLGL